MIMLKISQSNLHHEVHPLIICSTVLQIFVLVYGGWIETLFCIL